MSYNKVILQGNLTRDIELRYLESGSAIGSVGLAVTNKYKTKGGEQKEEVLFIDLTFFGRTAEVVNQYCRKGSKVLVDGTLKLNQWTKDDGTKMSKHTVTVTTFQMLDSKPTEQSNAPAPAPAPTPNQSYSPNDEEIPF